MDSPLPRGLDALFDDLAIDHQRVASVRKAISLLKKAPPDFIIAEFIYGYSTHYSGVHISNLDVLLVSLQKYSTSTRVIVIAHEKEFHHVHQLNDIFPIKTILKFPPTVDQIRVALTAI